MIYDSLTELVGGTPLLRVSGLEGQLAEIVLKLEYFNPGGSVKDRVALAMIVDAESKGILRPGASIIEPTSGNTGVGLAWVGRSSCDRDVLCNSGYSGTPDIHHPQGRRGRIYSQRPR